MTGESDTASPAAERLHEQQGAPLPSAEAQMVLSTSPHHTPSREAWGMGYWAY